jgi:tetratricopeptide (TPR) repeat protein
MLRGLVPSLPDRTTEAIVARAEGVPLYAIESVRMLLAEGRLRQDGQVLAVAGDLGELAELAIPETLTALVAARLDGLPPPDRALLLDAAVLGQSFAPAGLAAVSGRPESELEPPLQTLVGRELLRQVADPRSPERGRYVFVQALIREIAYGTLTKRDRVTRHLAVARWLQTLGDPELAAAVAGHLVAARKLFAAGPEADALGAEAATALRAAGDRAAALAVPSQALRFYEQAVALAPEPATQAELLELAGANAIATAEFDAAEAFATRAADLWRSLGHRPGTARATALRAKGVLQVRRYEDGKRILDPAIAEFADLGRDPAYLRLRNQQARLLFLSGALEPAVQLARALVDESAAADDMEVLGDALITLGSTLVILEQHEEGRALLGRAREIAEAHGLNSLLVRAINNSMIALMEEDPAGAWDVGLRGLEVATRLGQKFTVHTVGGNLCFVGIWTGAWAEAYRLAVEVLEDTGDPDDRIATLGSFTALKLLQGRSCEAEVAELVSLTRRLPDQQRTLYRDDILGYVDLVEGRIDDALARWTPIATDQSAAGLVTLVAHLEIWRGDPGGAERILDATSNLPDVDAGHVIRRGIAAGIAARRGDRAAALAVYRALVRDLPAWRVPVHEILFAIDMAAVIGPSEPFVAAEIARARETIERLGSPPLARLLDAAIAGDLAQARRSESTYRQGR